MIKGASVNTETWTPNRERAVSVFNGRVMRPLLILLLLADAALSFARDP